MKKILYSLAILFAVVGTALSQVPPGYTPVFNLFTTNVLMADATHSNLLNPGAIAVHSRGQAIIGMHSYPSGGAYGRQDGEMSLYYDNGLGNGGFFFDTNVFVTGDITASGTVSATTTILWVTNLVYATNATYATNDQFGFLVASTNYVRTNLVSGTLINYATNAQTTTVDMSIPYGDVDVAGGITFAGLSNTKDTAYQTAVVFVKNTTGVVAPIAFPATWTNTAGALRVTNYTICTIFRNPGRFTNIVTLPVW